MATAIFQLLRPKILVILDSCLSYFISDPLANFISSILKIYSGFDHFSPLVRLSSWPNSHHLLSKLLQLASTLSLLLSVSALQSILNPFVHSTYRTCMPECSLSQQFPNNLPSDMMSPWGTWNKNQFIPVSAQCLSTFSDTSLLLLWTLLESPEWAPCFQLLPF